MMLNIGGWGAEINCPADGESRVGGGGGGREREGGREGGRGGERGGGREGRRRRGGWIGLGRGGGGGEKFY
jgi:hypothetical protein